MTDQPNLSDFVADNLIHADTLLRGKLGLDKTYGLPIETLTALRAMPINFQTDLGGPILDKLIAHYRRARGEGASMLFNEHADFFAADAAIAATLTDAFAMAMQNMSSIADQQARARSKLLRGR
jgi:hypothetical protein